MTLSVSSRSSAADFAAPSVTAARRDRDGHEDVREIEGAKAAAEPTRMERNAVFMVAVMRTCGSERVRACEVRSCFWRRARWLKKGVRVTYDVS